MTHNFYLIGLIGNLGSGKSTVRRMLEELGARGVDADTLAHVAMRRGTPTWRAIVRAFGEAILMYDGRIDRGALAARVFADADALRTLETIVHPVVIAETQTVLRATTQPVVVLEAIKLFEAGMDQWCDALWAVTCAPETQIERVMRTRHLDAEHARARLAAQDGFAEKLRRADIVIDNSGDLAATRAQVARVWKTLRPEIARDKREWLWTTPSAPAPEIALPPVTPAVSTPPPAPVVTPEVTAPPRAPAPVVTPAISAPPAPAPTPEIVAPLPAPKPTLEFEVRRSRRSDLEALAVAIAKRENLARPLSHAETVKRLGSGGYRLAISDGRIVAYAAWEAENLVATIRELWAESNYIALLALPRLFDLIEEEAHTLLCEVSVLFLEVSAPLYLSEQAGAHGYQPAELANLHPVWQPIVRERLKPGERIWVKRLRAELITKPI